MVRPICLSLLLGIALVPATLPAAARDFKTIDEPYIICAFRDFANCDPLTEAMTQTGRFSEEEKRTLRTLKTFTDAPRSATLARFQQAFGAPTLNTHPGRTPQEHAISAHWATDPNGPCPLCGILAIFLPSGLSSVNYVVSNRFMIFWFDRSEATAPR